MMRLKGSISRGDSHVLTLDEPEINSFLGGILDFGGQTGGQQADRLIHNAGLDAAEVEEVRSSVRDFKINLQDDQLSVYMAFDFHGKAMSMSFTTRLRVEDHYLRLEPTGGHLGLLPLPASVLERAINRLVESPDNRETFRLPDAISEIRIENSELKVLYDVTT